MALPQKERRLRLERLLGKAKPPLYLTPMTTDRAEAQDWLQRFEGAGLDGVMAKPAEAPYQPGKRTMFKIKHVRTADCVVAGFRWYKDTQDAVGSLLLGLYDDERRAAARGRDLVVHAWPRAASWPRNWRRCARTRWPTIPGATGPAPAWATRSACPARKSAGAAARTWLGAAAARARGRGQVRPPAGRPLPPRHHLPALARRQAGAGLPLRPAGGGVCSA
jgi:hypothetical protein